MRDQTEQSLIDSEALIQQWHGKGRLGYAITPRFAPSCTDAQLRGAGELAAKYPNVWIQSHVAENKDETKLQDDLRNLRGEIERMRFELETQTRRSKDVGTDIERRLQKLEASPAAAGAPADGSAAPVVPAAAPVPRPSAPGPEQPARRLAAPQAVRIVGDVLMSWM